MSQYTYTIDHTWVHTPEEVNELIAAQEIQTLRSADQIICICWDTYHNAYLVCWRVRKWLSGSEG